MAIYGASPFYIFGILTLEKTSLVFLSAFTSMVLYWAFNSYLFFRSNITSKWFLYGGSYFFAYFSNVFKLFLGLDINSVRGDVLDYIIYPLITVLALNSIILIIIHSVIQEEEKIKAQERIASLNLVNLKAQKQTLTQQLQPHFLFNALSILKSLIHDNKYLAEKYTVQLSDFLRYSVDSHNNDLVTLEEELKFVKDYIDLQKIRFGEGFTYSLNTEEEVMQYKVPVFAIQTLVENAFKHNYFTEKNPMNISVKVKADKVLVSNDIKSLRLTERSGTGLENLKKRYVLYGFDSVMVDQSEKQFSVTIPILVE